MRFIRSTVFIPIFFLCLPKPAGAADEMFEALQRSMADLQKTVQGLQTTVLEQGEIIRQQSMKIEALEKGKDLKLPDANVQLAAAEGPRPLAGLSQGINPDIGVNGTVQTHLTQDSTEGEGRDAVALKELEVSFAQAVDPFSRLDAIIAFNDNLEEQNVDIEEAYYSRWDLPLDFQTQLGKFRSKIGKVNLQHLHQLPTANYPLVIRDFFGDEGMASSGVRLQNSVPNPWDLPFEVTGEVLRGNNGTSFSGVSRRPIFNTHAKTFIEVSKETNVELGWTTLFGDENIPLMVVDGDGNPVSVTRPQGQDHYGVKVYGADMTVNWLLPEEKQVKWQSEIYFQNRSNLVHMNDDPWGFYTLVDYRFSKRFSAGIRYDYLEPLDVIGQHNQSSEISPYLIFWQSEFADFKIQYSYIDPASADAKKDNAIFFTVDFLIGSHRHPVQ